MCTEGLDRCPCCQNPLTCRLLSLWKYTQGKLHMRAGLLKWAWLLCEGVTDNLVIPGCYNLVIPGCYNCLCYRLLRENIFICRADRKTLPIYDLSFSNYHYGNEAFVFHFRVLKHLDDSLKWSEVKLLSRIRLFATPWTIAYQAPPSLGLSRQECWSGLPFPSPGYFPNPGIEPRVSRIACRRFTIWATREASWPNNSE